MSKTQLVLSGVLVSTVFIALCISMSRPEAHVFCVSPQGDDTFSGTCEAPLASLQRAVGKAREIRDAEPGISVTILLLEGTHNLTEPIVFGPEDSGTQRAPFVIKGESGKRAVVSGGRLLDLSWEPYRDGIHQARGVGPTFDQLFVNGQRHIRARTIRTASWKTSSRNWTLLANGTKTQKSSGFFSTPLRS